MIAAAPEPDPHADRSSTAVFGAPGNRRIALGEIAIGLGTLLGLWARIAAVGGAVLSLTLFLTVSFHSSPYFTGASIVFLFAWVPLILAGSGGVLSLDGVIRSWARHEAGLPTPIMVPVEFGRISKCAVTTTTGVAPHAAGRSVMRAAVLSSNPSPRSPSRGGVTPWNAGCWCWVARRPGPPPSPPWPVRGWRPGSGVQWAVPKLRRRRASLSRRAAVHRRNRPPLPRPPPPRRLLSVDDVHRGTQARGHRDRRGRRGAGRRGGELSGPRQWRPVDRVATVARPVRGIRRRLSPPGCTVGYSSGAGLLVCPCHGSEFNPDTGAVEAGPASTGLRSIPIALGTDGQLYADG